MKYALFWDITQRILVIPRRYFGATFRPHLQGYPLKMGLIGCPETSVRNYQFTLPNITEDRIYQYLKFLLQGEIGTELSVKTGEAKRNEG